MDDVCETVMCGSACARAVFADADGRAGNRHRSVAQKFKADHKEFSSSRTADGGCATAFLLSRRLFSRRNRVCAGYRSQSVFDYAAMWDSETFGFSNRT